jgi:hypothetical protein
MKPGNFVKLPFLPALTSFAWDIFPYYDWLSTGFVRGVELYP